MKKILIVGGSHSEIPLVEAAKKLGLYVVTTGNQPHGLAHRYADEYRACDYSDKDAVLRLMRECRADYLCFGAHDLSMLAVAYTAERLGIDTFDDFETTSILHHKHRFKTFAAEHAVRTPRAYAFDRKDEAAEYMRSHSLPLIVKPVDMGGGKGICIVKNESQIDDALDRAFQISKMKNIVVEAFFEGTLHSLSMFVHKGRVAFYYADDEHPCIDNPFGVCTSASPSAGFDKVKKVLIDETNRVIRLLHLKDGLLHMQYLQNGNDFSIVEYTRRMPGDLYNVPVEVSTGMPYAETIVWFACGFETHIDERPQNAYVSRHCLVTRHFDGVVLDAEIKGNVFDELVWGDAQGTPKKGILFLKYNSHEEMQDKTRRIHELIRV